MSLPQKKIITFAAASIAIMTGLVFIVRSGRDTARPAEKASSRTDTRSSSEGVRGGQTDGGKNRLLELIARFISSDRPAETEDPAALHRRLMEKVSAEEKIPREALTPAGYGAEERDRHRRVLEEIAELGERVRNGGATPAERRRHRDLKIRLLEDKIRQIRGFIDTMQDYGNRGSEQNDDIARSVKTIERLESMADSLKKE